ncbi:allantoinase [Aquibacillus halophilus]|uniref:Allantoinase n=1 Tax=Aquibacillus halophilus TaxID=930132 RepID=A0A6A8DKQ9_9BACI|nr:allantoinase [Aquibacillus halophilus]MRH44339.1 allantoinase [Aquibacillus halophilus]
MKAFDLIIKNGNVVLPHGVEKTDIAIKDGKIKLIKQSITDEATEKINAENHYIFPGMIDVHVHFNEPGREIWEGFETGSFMMAAGGCTTYFDMPLNGIPSTTTVEALQQKIIIGEEKSCLDFGLWGGLVPGNIDELAPLAKGGVIGFKAFLSPSGNEEFEAADDYTLLAGMQEIARLGKVLALHAESGPMTVFLSKQKEVNKQFSADDFAETRPIVAELEAVERALYYAEITGCSLHFVHISSAPAVEKIRQVRQKGLDITVETCPHYLLFTHDDLIEKGPVAKCAPPLRSKEERSKLIEALLEDKLDMISSDHSPAPFELKDPKTHHFLNAWGGISGGQFSLLSMIELAIKHNIPFEKIAEWTAMNPAKRFNLESKGSIQQGLDADLAIISLENNQQVTPESFFAKHKQSLYMDHTFPCQIIETFARGKLVYQANKTTIPQANGAWLR